MSRVQRCAPHCGLTTMLNHARTLLPILAVLGVLTFLLGCSASHRQVSSATPAIVIDQSPDYPMPDHGSDFPGGLVAMLWRDGRMIRSTAPAAVGKSYVEGVVAPQQCEEFFSYVSVVVKRAPKIDGIPLHVATQSIIIHGDGHTSEWLRILPDTKSVWREVELRMLSLPLTRSNAVDPRAVENLK